MPTVPLDLEPATHERYLALNRIKNFRARHMDIYLTGLSATERAAKDFLKAERRRELEEPKEATSTL